MGGGPRSRKVCSDVIARDVRDIQRGGKSGDGPPCKFLFRGHINLFDYERGFQQAFVDSTRDVRYITFLREPLSRALSEYK